MISQALQEIAILKIAIPIHTFKKLLFGIFIFIPFHQLNSNQTLLSLFMYSLPFLVNTASSVLVTREEPVAPLMRGFLFKTCS